MYQYYILEIEKDFNGEYSHNVHWAYDEDSTKARLKAEAKYHEILSKAAVSNTAQHSASLISSDGRSVSYQCYAHDAVNPAQITE